MSSYWKLYASRRDAFRYAWQDASSLELRDRSLSGLYSFPFHLQVQHSIASDMPELDMNAVLDAAKQIVKDAAKKDKLEYGSWVVISPWHL